MYMGALGLPDRVLADPHLPQRAVAAQRRRHHLLDEIAKRTGRTVDVTIDGEGAIVGPLGLRGRIDGLAERVSEVPLALRPPVARLGRAMIEWNLHAEPPCMT